MSLVVSNSWSPRDVATEAKRLLQAYTVSEFANVLQATIDQVAGTHVLRLYQLLDACVKLSPKFASAILSARRPHVKRSARQSDTERAAVVAAVDAILDNWTALGLASIQPLTYSMPRRGYFWALSQRPVPEGKRKRSPSPPQVLMKKVPVTDVELCCVCGDKLGVEFCDVANGWVYKDAVPAPLGGDLVHVLCAEI
jgi:hypothetical protein